MVSMILMRVAFFRDRRGVTALEYGLIAGAIVAVIMVGYHTYTTGLSNKFSTIGGSL